MHSPRHSEQQVRNLRPHGHCPNSAASRPVRSLAKLRRTMLVDADKSGLVADEGLAHTLQPASTVAMLGGGDEGRG